MPTCHLLLGAEPFVSSDHVTPIVSVVPLDLGFKKKISFCRQMLLLELGGKSWKWRGILMDPWSTGLRNGSLATEVVLSSICWPFLGPLGRAFRAPIAH